jgi:hypothetical protein
VVTGWFCSSHRISTNMQHVCCSITDGPGSVVMQCWYLNMHTCLCLLLYAADQCWYCERPD